MPTTAAAPERLSVDKTYKLYINGAFPRSESGRSLIVRGRDGAVVAHVTQASRKDLRDAVEAAANAQPKWGSATEYNRGQVLYRMAEMLEGKREEFADALRETAKRHDVKTAKRKGASRAKAGPTPAEARAEVAAAIDRLMCFAGWADKYAQVLGCHNPVAGPFYNFTIPEPTGVVAVLSPGSSAGESPALLGLISLLAPPLCAGNAIVAIADEDALLPAAIFGEVCATSDVPPGVINILTGRRSELIEHLAQHRGVNAISAANLSKSEATVLKLGIAENLKRVRVAHIEREAWFDPSVCESPWTIEPFVEMKTIWHPSAT